MIADSRLPPGELQRLAECVLEPIRFPGAVQGHGALLAADPQTLVIGHVSDNTDRIFGARPLALLGRPLTDLFDAGTMDAIRGALDDSIDSGNPVPVTIDGQDFDAIAHETAGLLVVELEPAIPSDAATIMAIRGALRRFAHAGTVAELWEQTAIELRRITGFDRVMVYHFHPDGHGEVVAEARADDMEPYLGLHYPASDIPAQARALYVTKLSRMITSSREDSTAALLADANRAEPAAIDLSRAELRAVSPHHLQFMRNMGQASTFSLSIVRNGEFVGMITCAHRTERRIPYNIRDGLEIFANQVALQLGAMQEIERLGQRNRTREIRAALVTQVAQSDDLIEALLHSRITLLDLIPASGAAVRLSGRLDTLGSVPPRELLEQFGTVLAGHGASLDTTTESIPTSHPDLASTMPGFAGLLVRPIGGDGDYIAWFRGEITRTIDWLGDMSPANRLTPLSPRNSFSAWSEEVRGSSEPWDGLDDEARELGRDLESTMLHRVESRLAELALHDALTGLPNRRLLMERLDQSLSRTNRRDRLAVLFVDLDDFKAINDSLGHAAGDDVLVGVARSLRSAARSDDTVARLGGDEFVVLCDDIDGADAEHLAQRLLAAVRTVAPAIGRHPVSASIGVALAPAGADASQVLSAADTAMYRAKLAGRDRVAV